MRKNSIKHTRVNMEIQRELSRILREEVKDPRVGVMTSVNGVDVTTDLKTCKVYISVLGTEEEREAALAACRSAGGFIRHQLAVSLNLRHTPELIFLADNSIEYGVSMSGIIDDVIGKDTRNKNEQN